MKSIRRRIAFWIVRLAKKIDPVSPRVQEFYKEYLLDMALTGQAITRIDQKDFYSDKNVGGKSYETKTNDKMVNS